ncbi:MAG: pyrroloquinoline quinone biosynthesis protein PqqB [Acidobacteriia bacterium]|nr:pyrroloquinoline quinone biosynthesis protein PqqB [Terriglobia bacterium]
MRVEILGSAAGGGFPQWNCNCRNCQSLRAGTFQGKARTQTQVALTNDNQHWFLLNASPDLRLQIEATPSLHPCSGLRDSPISGVVLTSADIDQVAGLLSLRELQPFHIYCTPSLRRILRQDNSVFAMLNRISNQVVWTDIHPSQSLALPTIDGTESGICCSGICLGSHYPAYVSPKRSAELKPEEALLGLVLKSSTGGRLAYMPAVPAIDEPLLECLETVDVLLFDGTFWSDDELIRVQGSGATARDMGHVPVSGPDGSLRKLAGLHRPRKVFVHVNNTNPMLDESCPEYREVCAAGWEVAEDGWSFDL